MPVVVKDEARAFALGSFLRYLTERDLVVARDSCVAAALQINVTNRVMSSVVDTSLKQGWVRRSRDSEARDFYDNPVTYTITSRGREYLTAIS